MPKLPVLMYHGVSANTSNSKGLTISAKNLEAQFKFIIDNGYTTMHFSELQAMKSHENFPEKAVIITFDDVYVNQLEYAYPLLEKYGLKACFYIPFEYVGNVDNWNFGTEPIMNIEQLKTLKPEVIELGLHSFSHGNYMDMAIGDIDSDFEKCNAFIEHNKLTVSTVLAYPYGKYPKERKKQFHFFNMLNTYKITYGLRIGNRVNKFPFKNNYAVQRIDIKGEDTLAVFKRKLKKGKRWV